jgi:hypothetical protein
MVWKFVGPIKTKISLQNKVIELVKQEPLQVGALLILPSMDVTSILYIAI